MTPSPRSASTPTPLTGVSRRTALGLFGAVATATAAGSAVDALPAAAAAQAGEVTLDNGPVSATVTKSTAQIRDLRLVGSAHGNDGFNLVSGSGGQGYTTFDYYLGTTRCSRGLSGASYRRLPPIEFDAALIRPGANVVDLSPVRAPVAPPTGGNTVDNWMEPMAGVMYDVIRLQVKEVW